MISERTINTFLQSTTSEGAFRYISSEPDFWRLWAPINETNVGVKTLTAADFKDWLPELQEKYGADTIVQEAFEFYYPRVKIAKN